MARRSPPPNPLGQPSTPRWRTTDSRRIPRPMEPQTPAAATDRARLAVVLTTVAISVGGFVLFSTVPWSDWRTGLLLNLVENAILVAFSIWYKDRLIPQLMLFGFAVGLAEFPADAWLVQ